MPSQKKIPILDCFSFKVESCLTSTLVLDLPYVLQRTRLIFVFHHNLHWNNHHSHLQASKSFLLQTKQSHFIGHFLCHPTHYMSICLCFSKNRARPISKLQVWSGKSRNAGSTHLPCLNTHCNCSYCLSFVLPLGTPTPLSSTHLSFQSSRTLMWKNWRSWASFVLNRTPILPLAEIQDLIVLFLLLNYFILILIHDPSLSRYAWEPTVIQGIWPFPLSKYKISQTV